MYKKKFKGSEWDTILFTPLWAFGLVAAADGQFQDEEAAVLAKELAEALLYKDEFTREVLTSVATSMAETMAAYSKDKRNCIQGLGDAADLLDKRLPKGVPDDFRRTVLVICMNTAKAAGTGSGDNVAPEETTALAMVAMALRVPIPGV